MHLGRLRMFLVWLSSRSSFFFLALNARETKSICRFIRLHLSVAVADSKWVVPSVGHDKREKHYQYCESSKLVGWNAESY